MFSKLDLDTLDKDEPIDRCVVKLKTSYWRNCHGVNTQRSLTYLHRQCSGYNILDEEARSTCAEEAIRSIVNLDECEDGVYEVIACNESRDWETGYIDDYDLKLVPYEIPKV